MRVRPACVAMLAVMTAIGGLGVIPARAVETTTEKPSVQIPEDKALVYFVRPTRLLSRLITFLYIDDEFVGVVEDNSFTYAFVEEGRHELWTFVTFDSKLPLFGAMSKLTLGPPWEGSRFRAVRGRTYYFWFDDPGHRMDVQHVQLDEDAGAGWIDEVKFYATPTDKDVKASAQHLAKRSAAAVERFQLDYAEIPEHATPEVPADRTGLSRIDANTEVELVLIQTLWSERDATGDEVWFRVARDSAAAGGIWLREGTLVRGILHHVRDSDSSVGGGVLDVVIPALVAVDGTVVPTQAEILVGGKAAIHAPGDEDLKVGSVVWNLWKATDLRADERGEIHVDFDPDSFAESLDHRGEGTAAFLPLGSTISIYTRDPVWIAPVGGATDSEEEELSAPTLRLRVAPKTIRSSSKKLLGFLVRRPDRPAAVRVRSIAGQPPPVEIEAKKTKRVSEGWLCMFDRWQVVKFLPVANEQSHIALELEGEFEDGTPFVVEVPVDLKVP